MGEKGFKVVGIDEGVTANTSSNNLPGVVTVWSKVRAFLFQEIDLNKEIKLVLTPKQEKFFQDLHNFWCQEITFQKVKDFFISKN